MRAPFRAHPSARAVSLHRREMQSREMQSRALSAELGAPRGIRSHHLSVGTNVDFRQLYFRTAHKLQAPASEAAWYGTGHFTTHAASRCAPSVLLHVSRFRMPSDVLPSPLSTPRCCSALAPKPARAHPPYI